MATILTTSPAFAKVGDLPDRIAAAGFDLVRVPEDGPDFRKALAGAAYLVAGLPAVDAGVMDAGPKLKGILKHGVGVDSIDVAAATARGLPVCSTPGANAQAVAEMALGAIFALARNMVAGHLTVASGGWDRRRGWEVAGRTLGILGFGQVGRRLARMARGVGMQVIAHDPYPAVGVAEDLGVRLGTMEEVLAAADVLSLHLAGGPDTDGLIGESALAQMKPGAVLLNYARGSILDLDAVAAALDDGRLSGAAIDAFEAEPPDTAHPIFTAPNVLFSPHSGADTEDSLIRVGEMVLEDIETLAAGGMPARALNAKELTA
ncbi:phosphoglycerate dehydrogenase [Psychromarinibacter sp. C21-152]|uniref:Phosphoglycerate dehydrogenase n=1 Tax=Psychromarinibacter sediminicola TaxID=3033385 RepID=A0AAE3T8Q8_9RHOB|nr:phosphoglycerate dehydrogenase [Psychromarinibacter sediminicola]MDF0600294.1 phosphoglycerate dehydrogenase [Psychromarinibacter sediminicola]